jgi:CBS domain containing-hemolysin-like protein
VVASDGAWSLATTRHRRTKERIVPAMTLGLGIAVILVAANAFFVGAEFAIARLRHTQVAEYVRQQRPGARSAQHAVEHIDSYLSACQLGITLCSLGLGAVGEQAFRELLTPVFGEETQVVGFGLAAAAAFLIITVSHVVLGELAPKSAAIARTGPIALLLAPPMRVFYLVAKPIVDLLNAMGNLILKPFGIPPVSDIAHTPHSEDELRQLLRESTAGGLIHPDEGRLSEAALVFGDLRAREVMQPRSEIAYVTTADSIERVIETAVRTGRTRLPVVEHDGDLDRAIGVINAKDLLPAALGQTIDLRARARQLPRVAEGTRVDDVLHDMRRHRRHLALVVDEHGTVSGLLTIEDIIEELVGEIDDEFDAMTEPNLRREHGRLHIAGSASVRSVAHQLGLNLDAPHETTLSGYIIERLGRVPDAGEIVELGAARVEVLDAGETQITQVAIADPSGPTGPNVEPAAYNQQDPADERRR